MEDDRVLLEHASECLRRIDEYVAPGRDEFLRSNLVQDAVLRNLQVLVESLKGLSEAARSIHPEIPWREMIGFRNILVHDYLGVSLEGVWAIIENELPRLREAVRSMLADG